MDAQTLGYNAFNEELKTQCDIQNPFNRAEEYEFHEDWNIGYEEAQMEHEMDMLYGFGVADGLF